MPVHYSYISTPPMGRTASTEPQCLYSIAITLLPLWAVRHLQSLNACTVQLYLYSPQCLYSTAIPLLPLWAVRPVQSHSACTRVHFTLPTLQVCALSSHPSTGHNNTQCSYKIHNASRMRWTSAYGDGTYSDIRNVLNFKHTVPNVTFFPI